MKNKKTLIICILVFLSIFVVQSSISTNDSEISKNNELNVVPININMTQNKGNNSLIGISNGSNSSGSLMENLLTGDVIILPVNDTIAESTIETNKSLSSPVI